ncbi:MAG: TetR/AcrR family transcriptional regulator C-terminal domain-containing protein [Desulfosporosinus sp.]|nr:TetR/AcrR family transcriptional regulator C-terminal domain-containing protein [Desulfosporosinus sp.]
MKITKQNITEASWELLQNDGIEKFSMRKLATRLNIQAASLYWHLKSKQSLFQTLANEVSKETLLSVGLEGNWKEQLNDFAIKMRKTFKKYPCSAQLIMKTLPTEPEYLSLINTLLNIIDQTNLSDSDKSTSIICLINYAISFEIDKYEQDKINIIFNNETETVEELFKLSIEQLLDNNSNNIIQRMYNNENFEEFGSDKMLISGLNIFFMGIEQLMAK